MASKAYKPIDIHDKSKPGWPAHIPPMTAADATNAFKRLYRWAMGETFKGVLKITSGNRRAVRFDVYLDTRGRRCAFVNPSQGWRDFVHDLSHWVDHLANGDSEHGKHHARLEAKMIREVLKRGWLYDRMIDPTLPVSAGSPLMSIGEIVRTSVEPAPWPLLSPYKVGDEVNVDGKPVVCVADRKSIERQARIVRIDELLKAWHSKRKRAETFIKKLSKERARLAKKVSS